MKRAHGCIYQHCKPKLKKPLFKLRQSCNLSIFIIQTLTRHFPLLYVRIGTKFGDTFVRRCSHDVDPFMKTTGKSQIIQALLQTLQRFVYKSCNFIQLVHKNLTHTRYISDLHEHTLHVATVMRHTTYPIYTRVPHLDR